MQDNDKTLEDFKVKYKKSYGAGVFPWEAIIAALASILGGCVMKTPENLKKQAARPLVRIRLRRNFLASGVPASSCERAVNATVKAVADATDAELDALIEAAAETD